MRWRSRRGIATRAPVLHRSAVLAASRSPTARQLLHALALACLCSVLFLRGALLPGKALVPHPPELFDVVMAEAIERGEFDPADAFRGNVGMTDKYLQSLCWDRVMQDRFGAGEVPRWTKDIAGGAPFVPQMAQPFQPINLLLGVLRSEQWYGWWFFCHQVLFGFFAYCFLRRLGCAHGASLVGLVAAALGLWTQCKLHHNVILTAAVSLWPMLSAVHELVANGARGRARTFAVGWLGMWTGLSWSSGFVVVSLQATYLTLAVALLFTLQSSRGDRLRRLVPVGVGLALGALLSSANMIPVLLASAVSARAGTFDAERLQSLGLEWDHLLTVCWPDLLSWAADRFYLPADGYPFAFETRMPFSQLVLLADPLRREDNSAFQSWVETAFAIGLVPIACAVAALGDRSRRALVATLAGIGLLAFGMATAEQPFFGLARLLPGVTAGDQRRLLFTTTMALVVLAGLGADRLLRSEGRRVFLGGLAAAATVSVVALVWLAANASDAAFVEATCRLFVADSDHRDVIAVGGTVDTAIAATNAVSRPGEVAHNHTMLWATALRALLVAALAIGALWLRPIPRVAVWLGVTIAELLHAGLGPVQTVPAERVTRVPALLQPVAAANETNGVRPRLQRLLPPGVRKDAGLPGNLPGFLGFEDANAYNPLPPARSEEFFKLIDANAPYGGAGVGALRDRAALQHPLCDLFGIRFVLCRENVPTTAALVDRTPPGTGGYRLLERTTTLPRATFVRDVDVIADKAQRLAALAVRDRDVARRVVLEDEAAPKPTGAAGSATVTIVDHDDERVQIRVDAATDGYVRLADPWDAGWCAAIDGESTPVYVADHYLRAVYVPAGTHEIVFTYDGARVVWPLRLTLLAWAVVAWLLWTGRRRTP